MKGVEQINNFEKLFYSDALNYTKILFVVDRLCLKELCQNLLKSLTFQVLNSSISIFS